MAARRRTAILIRLRQYSPLMLAWWCGVAVTGTLGILGAPSARLDAQGVAGLVSATYLLLAILGVLALFLAAHEAERAALYGVAAATLVHAALLLTGGPAIGAYQTSARLATSAVLVAVVAINHRAPRYRVRIPDEGTI